MEGNYVIAIDLGKIVDPSAMAVTERLVRLTPRVGFADQEEAIQDDIYRTRRLHRWELGTPYPKVISDVGSFIQSKNLRDAALVIDATGVGKEVLALFEIAYQRGLLGNSWPWGMIITGGREVNWKKRLVPKSELVSKVQAVLQTERWKVVQSEWTPILKAEMINFKTKITSSGQETWESAREGEHDDLVLAVAMSCWYRHQSTEPKYIEAAAAA